MFDEPDEAPNERIIDPAAHAREKSDEFRMHAELAAVFEGPRKSGSEVHFDLEYEMARDLQKRFAGLARSKIADIPVLPALSVGDAASLLSVPATAALHVNDYYVYRRPGEVMIVRWIEGDQVESFYERFQAHFDAALDNYRQEQRQAHAWKQDARTQAYLAALDGIDTRMAQIFLRDMIREFKVFVLSTLTADELNLQYLAEDLMGLAMTDLATPALTPAFEPTQRDLAWFFKLFSLRGVEGPVERACFFAFLQKAEDTFDLE